MKEAPMMAVAVPAVLGNKLKHFAMELGKIIPDAIKRKNVNPMSVHTWSPKRKEIISMKIETKPPYAIAIGKIFEEGILRKRKRFKRDPMKNPSPINKAKCPY